MKKIIQFKRFFAVFLATIVAVLFIPSIGVTASEAEEKTQTVITNLTYNAAGTGGSTYSDSYIRADEYGQYLWVSGKLTTESGEPLSGRSIKVYYAKSGSNARYSSGVTNENGVFYAKIGGRSYFTDGSVYTIHAEFVPSSKDDKNTYESAATEGQVFSIIKQAKPVLTTTPEHQKKGDGSITVAEGNASYQYAEKNPALSGNGNTQLYNFSGNTASDLPTGTYYVRAKAYVASNTLYLASDYVSAEVGRVDYVEYTVTLENADHASWTGNGGESTFSLKEETGEKSVYITPDEGYVVESVIAEPSDGAVVTYNFETGEVNAANIKSDITLTPVVREKKVPTSLQVEYQFQSEGNYSEESPAVKVEFTVTAEDQNGDAVSGAKVYFKQDETDVSFSRTVETDVDGKSVLTYVYTLGEHTTEESWTSLFAFDSEFTQGVTTQDIRVVLQKKADLVLYEHQLIGTDPNENNGKVIDVPENYQIWTGEVHQGALVVGSGEWQNPVNGEFSGLSAGQHILRAGEYANYEANTFYLASDFADFFIPRGSWRVTVDIENSEHIVLQGEAVHMTNPGGTVYIYVEPEEGYEITACEINKPSYISGSVSYSEANGFVVISGVTGNIVLTVKAEKIEISENEPPVSVPEENDKENSQTGSKSEDNTDTEEPTTAIPEDNNKKVGQPKTKSGSGTASEEVPKTGDSNNTMVWNMLLTFLLSAVVVVRLGISQWKNRKVDEV